MNTVKYHKTMRDVGEITKKDTHTPSADQHEQRERTRVNFPGMRTPLERDNTVLVFVRGLRDRSPTKAEPTLGMPPESTGTLTSYDRSSNSTCGGQIFSFKCYTNEMARSEPEPGARRAARSEGQRSTLCQAPLPRAGLHPWRTSQFRS